MKKVLVPVANGTEEAEAIISIDLLRRAGADVLVAGLSDTILASNGARIIPDKLLEDVKNFDDFDVILLPGGLKGVENFINSKLLSEVLKNHYSNKKIIAAICAAPWVLAENDILCEDDNFTCYPSIREKILLKNYCEEKVICTRNQIITSQGLGTAIDFALEIIEKIYDKNKRQKISDSIMFR